MYQGIYNIAGWNGITIKEASFLRVGDKVDVRDSDGRYFLAIISKRVQIDRKFQLLIHQNIISD